MSCRLESFRRLNKTRQTNVEQKGCIPQVEAKCQVRMPVAAPSKGCLPLPQGLDKGKWDQAPKRIEDLQPICAQDYPKLEAPQYPPQVFPTPTLPSIAEQAMPKPECKQGMPAIAGRPQVI